MKGHLFKFYCLKLFGPFSQLYVVKLHCCLKLPKINKKRVRNGPFVY